MEGCIDAIRYRFVENLSKSHINLSTDYKNGFHAALKEVEDKYIDTKEIELMQQQAKYECKIKELSDQHEREVQILKTTLNDTHMKYEEYKAKWEVIELLFGKKD